MPNWNGMTVTPEAHRLAIQIEQVVGQSSMDMTVAVSGETKALLRKFYQATGGKRGAGGYEPSAQQLRQLYNGLYTNGGADVLKMARSSGYVAGDTVEDVIAVREEVERPLVIDTDPDAAALAAIKALMGGQKLDPEAVKRIAVQAVDGRVGEVLTSMAALVADEVGRAVRTIKVTVANLPEVVVDKAHYIFERVLRYVANRKNVMLVGPAGSGKTFLAEQIATSLSLPYEFSGKCVDEVKLLGYMDGGGTYRSTAFRRVYEFGGVFLADEMDAWSADALIALNAPLAGKWGDFPDGKIARHPDFVMIAATNTFGRGADRQYVGREQLDAASLDRFAVIEMEYDEDLELAISCDANWTKYVQKVRAAVMKEGIRHVVSPRASIEGGVMIAAGEPQKDVESAYIWKGLEETVKNRVLAAMR